jgi:hypothetical protein
MGGLSYGTPSGAAKNSSENLTACSQGLSIVWVLPLADTSDGLSSWQHLR